MKPFEGRGNDTLVFCTLERLCKMDFRLKQKLKQYSSLNIANLIRITIKLAKLPILISYLNLCFYFNQKLNFQYDYCRFDKICTFFAISLSLVYPECPTATMILTPRLLSLATVCLRLEISSMNIVSPVSDNSLVSGVTYPRN